MHVRMLAVQDARTSGRRQRPARFLRRLKLAPHPGRQFNHTRAVLEIRKQERTIAAHFTHVPIHDFERRFYTRREIDLVDYQQIGVRDAGTSLARDFVAGSPSWCVSPLPNI